jgi:ATP-dependent exoDNAse (exonuclease V) beta subunit
VSELPLKIFNASAGSGKTYTLVQEYLRIVLHSQNPHKFRHILAMTFTNKAANEMKERILDGLIQLARPIPEKSEKELAFLAATAENLKLSPELIVYRAAEIRNNILHNYGAFSVMTIDKFTHKIIRTFAKDLNLSIDFDVELDLKKLRKNITDMLFDQIGRDPELTRLMLHYAESNLEEDKSWNFSQQLYEFSQQMFQEGAINAIQRIRQFKPEDFIQVRANIVKENSQFMTQLKRNAEEALDLIKSHQLDQNDFVGKSRSVYVFFKKILAGETKLPSGTIINYVEEGKWAHPASANPGAVEEIAPLLEKYFHQILTLLNNEYKEYCVNLQILKNLNNLSLLNHLSKILEKVKEDNNVLLISDFYRKIAAIIVEEPVPFIYERLGVRYHHFLLDEFQDTSQLQWVNLVPLVHNSLAFENQNLIVGDGKQAIYRWRNGEVEQFTKLPNAVHNPEEIATLKEAEPLFRALGSKHTLKTNYRSAPEIVQFNNALFKSIVNGLPAPVQAIYEEVYQESAQTFKGYVESLFQIDLDEDDQLAYVLETVERSLKKGYRLSDICIIVRTNTKGSKIARYLTVKGYKVISPDSLFIGKDLNVKLVTNVIGAILTPSNRNYKIKALEHYAGVHQQWGAREIIEQFEDRLHQIGPIAIFETFGIQLKEPIHFHNLYEFVEHIIEAFQLSLNENPFLQFLMEQVHLFEKRNNSNARDFINWYFEHGKDSSIISPDGAEAIQVMTIHKSKGLQFPIVICPFFDWRFDIHKQIAWVEDERHELPTYFVKMVKELEDSPLHAYFDEESYKYSMDQLNMLYVAFTRPEIALFTCGKASGEKNLSAWLNAFFSQTALGERNEERFKFGEFEKNLAELKAPPPLFDIGFFTRKMDKPTLSFKSSANWDIQETIAEGLDQRRLFGTKVHLTLAFMKSPSDLEPALEQLLKKGKVNTNEVTAIREKITTLLKNRHFESYFSESKQYNEQELIDRDGKLLIPDKIIQRDEQILVVDFKTGQSTPRHKKQISEYIQTLSQMGHSQVRGEIFYTENAEIVHVQA